MTNQLQHYRERAGLSIQEAAELAGFKGESGWRGIERGRRVPQFAKIRPILDAVSCRGKNRGQVKFEQVWCD